MKASTIKPLPEEARQVPSYNLAKIATPSKDKRITKAHAKPVIQDNLRKGVLKHQNKPKLIRGDSIHELPKLQNNSIHLIYIDPPFNTGKQMSYNKIKTIRDAKGDRVGYNNATYRTELVSAISYNDKIDNYVPYIIERIKKAYPLLTSSGSLFIHVDYREVHYLKIEIDKIFGRENFINEIIWSYDYGARSRKKWSCKHDNILWYAVDRKNYTYNYDQIDRIPYMAPDLVGPEKAQRGKTPTDVWWNSVIGTNSKERRAGTGYPTQKPLAILERIVLVHSNEGDTVLDFFAGTGTAGVAAIRHNRKAILIDTNPQAIEIAINRIENEE